MVCTVSARSWVGHTPLVRKMKRQAYAERGQRSRSKSRRERKCARPSRQRKHSLGSAMARAREDSQRRRDKAQRLLHTSCVTNPKAEVEAGQ